MEKIVSMTAEEIREKYGKDREKAIAAAKAAPEFSSQEMGVKPGRVAARGFAAFKEHINRNGRPKAEDPKVSISIRIPRSKAVGLRASGRGWQKRISDYLVEGINNGSLSGAQMAETVSDITPTYSAKQSNT